MGQSEFSKKWLESVLREPEFLFKNEEGFRTAIKTMAQEILDLQRRLDEAQAARPEPLIEQLIREVLKGVQDGYNEAVITFKLNKE